jgi:hypothetical protein
MLIGELEQDAGLGSDTAGRGLFARRNVRSDALGNGKASRDEDHNSME